MRILIKILFVMVLCLAGTVVGHAQDTRAQEAKKAKLEREIAIIDKQLAEKRNCTSVPLSTSCSGS